MQIRDLTLEDFTIVTDKAVILETLESIVNSPEFSSSKRSQKLLRYIVKQTLAGNGDQINGTTIAQDILGFGPDFDSATNPLVRVQAGRMRKLLGKYYRHRKDSLPLIIYVAKGQYIPQFGYRKESALSIADLSPTKGARQNYVKWASLLLVPIALIAMFVFRLKDNAPTPPQDANVLQNNLAYPHIVILPFQNLTSDPKNDVFRQGFQHQLGSDLSRFRIVKVSLSNLQRTEIVHTSPPMADYLLEGTFLSVKDGINLSVKLTDLKTGELIKQHQVERQIGDSSYFDALIDISSSLSVQFAGPKGVLVKQSLEEIKRSLELGNHQHGNMEAFGCLSVFNEFGSNKTAENFDHAAQCLPDQVSKNPEDSSLLAALAWLTVYGSPDTGLYKTYQTIGDNSLTKAIQLAQKAVALNPGNSIANHYMALIQWRMGEREAAIQSIRRCLQHIPSSSDCLSNLGQFLTFTGDWENGLVASKQAIASTPTPSYWYYTTLFMKAVLDKNAADAMFYAKKHEGLISADGSVYPLIAASIAGNQELIKKYKPAVETFAKEHSNDPLYITRRWVQSPEIIQALEEELRAVGVATPKN